MVGALAVVAVLTAYTDQMDLHDSVTQSLYGASLYAEAANRALADGDIEPVSANLREVRDTLQEALGEMRLLLFELRPPLLDELGLAGALKARLQAVEARAGLETEFQDCSDGQRLLEITNNGMGFTHELDGAGGFGLEGMQQRIERLGGTLRIESGRGNGTRVQAHIPR